MTIYTGTAEVDANDNVKFVSPLGFGASRAIRIANLSNDVVTLVNIYEQIQGTEYLMPYQQMVYQSANVSATPGATGQTLTGSALADVLYAEWSTEPEIDFIGTYPTSISEPGGGGGGGGPVTQATIPWIVDGSGVTQPVSAAALPLPAGAATSAKQPVLGQAAMAASLPVAVASDQTALPITAAALPLPAGAATSAKQPALGAAVTAASTPVNVASDQTVPVSAAALPLPAGAATSAKQPALGQAAMAASLPVAVASDQTGIPITAAALPLPAGAATSAKQPALGAAVTAASTPVNVASDQTVPISALISQLPHGSTTKAFAVPVTLATDNNAIVVDGSAVTQPVKGASTVGLALPAAVLAVGFQGTTGNVTVPQTSGGDAIIGGAVGLIGVAMGYGFNGSTNDRLRVATTFKTAKATASGDTALWTPSAGKKFRVMAYFIQVTADAATAGGADIDIVLRDSTTATAFALSCFVPAAAATILGPGVETGWCPLGNGLLSAVANNVLNINLSAALTSGTVRVVAIGTEE